MVEVTAMFLADYAKTDASNKVNALGVFSYTEADAFPALMPEFYLAINLNAQRSELTSPMTIDLSLEGGVPDAKVFSVTQEMETGEIQGPGRFVSANMIFGFTTLVLPTLGRYVFSVNVNDQARGEAVLYATTSTKGIDE